MVVQYRIGSCFLGSILVAATDRGLCAILLGDDPALLENDLRRRFQNETIVAGDADFERWIASAIAMVEAPASDVDLPLDVHGTDFQRRVWNALRTIPAGSTATYADIAQRIGQPKAVRAVGLACGANPVAVAIPCHRVLRADASLSGYRWGIERKAALLKREGIVV